MISLAIDMIWEYNRLVMDSYDRISRGPCSPEIDLHGLIAEEAVFRLEHYLNEAFMAGLPWVRVVHGKGLGTLRHATRELLEGHPLVRSFRPGEPVEGGGGVTMVELMSR